MSKRENRTGRRRSVKAPAEERLERVCPHLAFIEPERYDRVLAKVNARNAWCQRRKKNGRDPRAQIPKKRTRYPGQAIFCGVCGRVYFYAAHTKANYLVCSGAREHVCWNGVTCEEVDARKRLCKPVFEEFEQLPEFDAELFRHIREQEHQLATMEHAGLRDAEGICEKLNREIDNVVDFIREGDGSPILRDELARLERGLSEANAMAADLRLRQRRPLTLPNAGELRALAREAFEQLNAESFDFARQMRRLTPRIVVFPHQLCDGGRVVLRASFWLRFSALVRDPRAAELLAESLDRVITVDLFKIPQRAAHRAEILRLRKDMTEAEAAQALGLTVTAAQKAAALQRKMDALGITDPYLRLTAPPHDSKLRRHLHRRYRFTPLEDAGQL